MKSLYLLSIILILVSCGQKKKNIKFLPKNNKEEFNLNGKVKSVSQFHIRNEDKEKIKEFEVSFDEGGSFSYRWLRQFDKKIQMFMLVEESYEVLVDSKETMATNMYYSEKVDSKEGQEYFNEHFPELKDTVNTTLIYNDKGDLIQRISSSITRDTETIFDFSYEYMNNVIVKKTTEIKDQNLWMDEYFDYDSDGRVVNKSRYYLDQNKDTATVNQKMEYNENDVEVGYYYGSELRELVVCDKQFNKLYSKETQEGSTVSKDVFEYVYDENDNWTEQKRIILNDQTNTSDTIVTERYIVYY
jgi:hypothetical protein